MDDRVTQQNAALVEEASAAAYCGFAHEGEEIEAAVDGILTANETSLLVRAALDGIWIANFPE